MEANRLPPPSFIRSRKGGQDDETAEKLYPCEMPKTMRIPLAAARQKRCRILDHKYASIKMRQWSVGLKPLGLPPLWL